MEALISFSQFALVCNSLIKIHLDLISFLIQRKATILFVETIEDHWLYFQNIYKLQPK